MTNTKRTRTIENFVLEILESSMYAEALQFRLGMALL